MALKPVTKVKISRLVNRSKGSASSSPDCIPTKMVKFVLPLFLFLLKRLVNLSYKNDVFLKSIKLARATVLYKGGLWSNPANDRLISLLSGFSV